jgi:rare lipoprotein A
MREPATRDTSRGQFILSNPWGNELFLPREPYCSIDRWPGSQHNGVARLFASQNLASLLKSLYLPRVLALAAMASLFLTGCGEKRAARTRIPPPPSIPDHPASSNLPSSDSTASAVEPSVPLDAKPLYTQSGLASWYGPDYNKRKGANGEIYDMHQLTAAHLTIPLNSIVRVTNLATGESVLVRITDRGPFVADRIIDLSLEAAKRISVYRPGIARVKLELLQSPANFDNGGRWVVQIGAFNHQDVATEIKDKLERRYHSAQVLQFKGPRHDWWVRVRVLNDDKKRAQELAHENTTPEGGIYLVRID